MKQLELDLYFPLTEQLPLDLDYSDCNKRNISSIIGTGNYILTGPINSINTINKTVISLDHKIEVQQKNMPWYRKVAFKLLGFEAK